SAKKCRSWICALPRRARKVGPRHLQFKIHQAPGAFRMSRAPVLVGVVMGSSSDWDTLRTATEILAEFGIPFEARVVSAHRMTDFIAPGATLGVMGGGQLGRMFVHAAQQMGYSSAVLDPDPMSPAGLVAHRHLQADYLDDAALADLARCSAAITTEFENIPAA